MDSGGPERIPGGMKSLGDMARSYGLPIVSRKRQVDTKVNGSSGYMWRYNGSYRWDCVPCNNKRLRLPVPAVPHTCGESVPRGPALKSAAFARREEAEESGECLKCLGAGFVYEYDVPERKRIVSAAGPAYAPVTDNRGTRYLVRCRC